MCGPVGDKKGVPLRRVQRSSPLLRLEHGPPAASTGKFTVRLLHAMSQPLRVDFFHRPRAKMAVALFPACQRCWPGEIGPIGDDMRKR